MSFLLFLLAYAFVFGLPLRAWSENSCWMRPFCTKQAYGGQTKWAVEDSKWSRQGKSFSLRASSLQLNRSGTCGGGKREDRTVLPPETPESKRIPVLLPRIARGACRLRRGCVSGRNPEKNHRQSRDRAGLRDRSGRPTELDVDVPTTTSQHAFRKRQRTQGV